MLTFKAFDKVSTLRICCYEISTSARWFVPASSAIITITSSYSWSFITLNIFIAVVQTSLSISPQRVELSFGWEIAPKTCKLRKLIMSYYLEVFWVPYCQLFITRDTANVFNGWLKRNSEMPWTWNFHWACHVRTFGRYSVLAVSTKIPHHSNGSMIMLLLFLTVADRTKASGKVYQGSSPVEPWSSPPCSLSKLLLREESSYGWIQAWSTIYV